MRAIATTLVRWNADESDEMLGRELLATMDGALREIVDDRYRHSAPAEMSLERWVALKWRRVHRIGIARA